MRYFYKKTILAVIMLLLTGGYIHNVNLVKKVSENIVIKEKYVAITFDDGPDGKTTENLLEGLKERGVVATFFIVGENIEGNEEVIKKMYEEGHLIGNHTYSHINLMQTDMKKSLEEIEKTNEKIYEITGYYPQYIRAPYGKYDRQLEDNVDMIPVFWDVDPNDWNTKDCGKVVRTVVDSVSDGDIILMHDIYNSSVVAALEIIDELRQRGYVFVTVDQIILD